MRQGQEYTTTKPHGKCSSALSVSAATWLTLPAIYFVSSQTHTHNFCCHALCNVSQWCFALLAHLFACLLSAVAVAVVYPTVPELCSAHSDRLHSAATTAITTTTTESASRLTVRHCWPHCALSCTGCLGFHQHFTQAQGRSH